MFCDVFVMTSQNLLSKGEKEFLTSQDKRGYNASEYYKRMEEKAMKSFGTLIYLAKHLPKDKFQKVFSEENIDELIRAIIHNANIALTSDIMTKRTKDFIYHNLDPHGTKLAEMTAGQCIDKLKIQYHLALTGEKQSHVLENEFKEHTDKLRPWLSLIKYKVEDKATNQTQ